MNNIFLPNDPLLFNNPNTNNIQQMYEQKLIHDRDMLDKQYNDYVNSLRKPQIEDKIAQLNTSLKELTQEIKDKLMENSEFVRLNAELQEIVQNELVETIKYSLNSNPSVISNVNQQVKIIGDLTNKVKEDDRKNMSEINDYLKNYSNMTFDDYKKLKDNVR